MKILNIIYLLILFILVMVIRYQHKNIIHFKSILQYYRWHDCLTDAPKHNGKYLVQTNDENNKIKVLFYNTGNQQWNLSNEINVVAWCHLPNYLYPKYKN